MNESKATRYQRLSRRARGARVIASVLALAALAASPATGWIAGLADRFASGAPTIVSAVLSLVFFVAAIVVICELAGLPAMLYLALRIDRVYAADAVEVEDVLGAEAQAALMTGAAACVAAAVVVGSVWVAGRWWWALAGALLAAIVAAAVRGGPALLARLAEVRPLDRPNLSSRLDALARRAGVPVARMNEWRVADAARTTALVSGAGRTRHVLISSELLRQWSDEEIEVVIAHELAHHAFHDLWRTLAVDTFVLCASLATADLVVAWLEPVLHPGGPGTLRALPITMLAAGLVWMAATPLRHAQSRAQERRADLFALRLTGSADAFGATIRRLGARHLSEERPSRVTRWLYHRHPPVAERLALAEAYRRDQT